MNYDQLIDKCNKLEETLDIVLMTMVARTNTEVELYEILDRKKARAEYRHQIRRADAEIRKEHWDLTERLKVIETDHPELKRKCTS